MTYTGERVTEMLEQYATADCLSCLLNRRKDLEFLPEPFRMQDSVTFRVTPSAYTEFVLTLTPESGVLLTEHIDVLKRLAAMGSSRLYNYFLADIAFAMVKEISYAERYRRYATIILPTSQSANPVNLSYVVDLYSALSYGVEYDFRKHVSDAGFELPKQISSLNVDLYKAAVVLYSLSKCSTAVKEVNLLYDYTRKIIET